ncbi:TPA: hypothetical protein N0F65_008998 [Lagenidium giganteum]|uniref:Zinc transporter n=1 Tax=Lagenidium giganteum TaxID=4803 RepID=A0AAV2YS13_9STRA|nr:TPA: hypothetical protein N0F65_008998 [Lagenidium giganteum]
MVSPIGTATATSTTRIGDQAADDQNWLIGRCARLSLAYAMGLQTGDRVAYSFVLTLAASAACLIGGLMVYSMRLLALAQPSYLSVLLCMSAYMFFTVASTELLVPCQTTFDTYMVKHHMDPSISAGCSWLFALMSVTVGILAVYSASASIQKISSMGSFSNSSNSYPSVLTPSPASLSQVEIIVNALSPSTTARTRSASEPFDFDRLPSTNNSIISSTIESSEASRDKRIQPHIDAFSFSTVVLFSVPEGIAVYVAAQQRLSVGLALTFGIALHSIPDGIALASSIYCASGKRSYGILWCAISTMARQFGAVIAWLLTTSVDLTLANAGLLGISTGILIGTSFREILPTAYNYAGGRTHSAVLGVTLGMLITALSSLSLE